MIDEKFIYYIIPIIIILVLLIIFFIYINKNKNNNINNNTSNTVKNNNNNKLQKNIPKNETIKIDNFIYKCQYKLQSYNNGYVLIDKNNKIIKQFKSKQQYLNYVKFELPDTHCIISDTATEYSSSETNLLKEKEKELKKLKLKLDNNQKNINIKQKNNISDLKKQSNNNKLIIEQQKKNQKNIKQNMIDNKTADIQNNIKNIKKQNIRDANKYARCFKKHNECLNKNNNNPKKCDMRKCLLEDDLIKENSEKNYDNIYKYRDNWTMPQALPPICIPKNEKCQVCPQFIDKNTNNLLQISNVDDTVFDNWEEGNKINKNFDIITSKWVKKNDPAEPQNYIPSVCPFDDCKPCEHIINNKSEHPNVIIGQNLLPKFKYELI